jgi:type IV pilus assembly protein PilY1
MVQVARAANTTLTDIPIASKVTAKPNIFYTLDDSGSMNLSYIPDYVIGAGAPSLGYCRNTAGTGPVACGTTFNWGREVPMFTADFNRLYYNPNVTYDPPADKNGRQSTVLVPDALALYQPQDAAHTTN